MIKEFKRALQTSVFVLAAIIPIMVPLHEARQDIDLKMWLLAFTGFIAWLYIVLSYKKFQRKYSTFTVVLLGLFISAALISSLLSYVHSGGLDFLYGSANHRIGLITFLSCSGIGIVFSELPTEYLLERLYYYIIGFGALSLLHDLIFGFHAGRLAGTTLQADALAVCLGVGFVIGLFKLKKHYYHALIATQAFLLICIYLTQTRAVLLLLAVALFLFIAQIKIYRKRLMVVSILLFIIAGLAVPRLSSTHYFTDSISYRLELQAVGVRSLPSLPIFGYGINSLYNGVLSCRHLHDPALLVTCHQGIGFDSTHNIFLDRLLEIGWIGGISYFVLYSYAIVMTLRRKVIKLWPVLAIAVLIYCYYFTNVTTIEVELISWIAILQLLVQSYSSSKTALQ